MARSASVDPVEKFRYKITVINLDLNILAVAQTVSAFNPGETGKLFTILDTVGFSEITLPRVTISEINYRENIDSQRFMKIPGLARYEPISLKRGVTKNKELYNWYEKINNDLLLLSTSVELPAIIPKAPPQTNAFRREVIIEVLDREGNTTKLWILFNAWPNSYKPGNDLSSNSEEKLIQEMGLTYEHFIELVPKGNTFSVNDLLEELAREAADIALNELGSLANKKITNWLEDTFQGYVR